jgi:hypothetical protein
MPGKVARWRYDAGPTTSWRVSLRSARRRTAAWGPGARAVPDCVRDASGRARALLLLRPPSGSAAARIQPEPELLPDVLDARAEVGLAGALQRLGRHGAALELERRVDQDSVGVSRRSSWAPASPRDRLERTAANEDALGTVAARRTTPTARRDGPAGWRVMAARRRAVGGQARARSRTPAGTLDRRATEVLRGANGGSAGYAGGGGRRRSPRR